MRRFGVVCAIALLVGCSGSTSVRPFGGAYDLISIDGQRIPQPLYKGSMAPDIVGGTLNVWPDSLDLTLSEQNVDSAGRPTGDVEQLAAIVPYVRQGDSLFTAADTSGRGDALFPTTPANPIGRILGSNVVVTVYLPVPSSTGFRLAPRRYLFTPLE